jgi:hypothetical protein
VHRPFVEVIAVAGALTTMGCSFSARIAAGPTLDTRKNPGFETQVLVGLGFGDDLSVTAAPVVGGGVGNGGEPLLLTGLEVAATQTHLGPCVASRFGGRFVNRNFFAPDEPTILFGGGVVGGVYGIVSEERNWLDRTEFRLGAEAQAELLGGDGARGHFGLPLVFEFFTRLRDLDDVPCQRASTRVSAPQPPRRGLGRRKNATSTSTRSSSVPQRVANH